MTFSFIVQVGVEFQTEILGSKMSALKVYRPDSPVFTISFDEVRLRTLEDPGY